MKTSRSSSAGVALFILLTSIVLISLIMRDLIQSTSIKVDRVRNTMNRIQAIYLARSALNLSRFFIVFDQFQSGQNKEASSDHLQELWAKPIPFPIPSAVISEAITGGSKAPPQPEDADRIKKCEAFFEDFPGSAVGQSTDLNSKISLNDIAHPSKLTFETFEDMLSPNPEFLRGLNARNINPETLTRQIRDYIDDNTVEDETKTPEDLPYISLSLPYGPKNRPLTTTEELTAIPLMDDELYEYLAPYVTGIYIASRTPPAKINLNTVSKPVFQALLKNVAQPEDLADAFMKDREKSEVPYTDKNLTEELKSRFKLDNDTIRLGLLTGSSTAFEVNVEAEVGKIKVNLETLVPRTGGKGVEPLQRLRVYP